MVVKKVKKLGRLEKREVYLNKYREADVYGDKVNLFIPFLRTYLPEEFWVFNTENDGGEERIGLDENCLEKKAKEAELYATCRGYNKDYSNAGSNLGNEVYIFDGYLIIVYSCNDSFAHVEWDVIVSCK